MGWLCRQGFWLIEVTWFCGCASFRGVAHADSGVMALAAHVRIFAIPQCNGRRALGLDDPTTSPGSMSGRRTPPISPGRPRSPSGITRGRSPSYVRSPYVYGNVSGDPDD